MTAITVWTITLLAIMILGGLLSVFDVRDARRERRTLVRARRTTGLNWIVANGNLRTAYFTFGVFVCFGMACIVALAVENATVRQVVIRVGFTGGGVMLMLKRVFDRFDRRKIHQLQRRVPLDTTPGSPLAVLGGPAVMEQIVAELYARLLRDTRLAHYFRGMRVSRLIHAQTDLLIDILSDRISEMDLRSAHAHLRISPDDFDHFVDIFREVLADFEVAAPLSARILEIVANTREQIVTRGGLS